MKLKSILNKAFTGGFWMVGLKDNKSGRSFFSRVQTPKGQWLADPFLVEAYGRHYLFVEQYFEEKNRAALGVYEICDGKVVNNHVVIDKPFHLSYPCVFFYQGKFWMIPESSSNKSLDLYCSKEFPYKWEHTSTLINERRVVDTTVYINDDDVFLLSYEKRGDVWALTLYSLDMNAFALDYISELKYQSNVGRPAGNLFIKDGHLCRPAQNCANKYGESILIYEIDELSNNSYCEHLIDEIKVGDIVFDEHFDRIHTFNKDSRYEVIDAFQEKLDLFRWWKIIKRQYLKK